MDAVLVAFASGKGGTGKTAVAAHAGAALAALGRRVLLVEFSPGLRSADIITGTSDEVVFDLADVLAGRSTAERAICKSEALGGLEVLCAPYEEWPVPKGGIARFFARQRANYDYILLDVAAGLGDAFSEAAGVAHRIAFVVTPDLAALRSTALLAGTLGGDPARLRLIYNRVATGALPLTEGFRDLDDGIDIVGAQLLGVVPESADMLRATGTGGALAKNSLEARVFTAIAKRITGEDVPLVVQ